MTAASGLIARLPRVIAAALVGGTPLAPGTYRVKVFATDLVTGMRSAVTTAVVVIAE